MTTLNFKIQNNSGIPDDQVFIGFTGSDLNATINGAPMESIQNSKWYQFNFLNNQQHNYE